MVERVVAFSLRFPGIVLAATILIILGGILAIWKLERGLPSNPPPATVEPRSQAV